MAVWPYPAHGTCSYGYFKISVLTFRKVYIFENVENLDYTLLDVYLFCLFQGTIGPMGPNGSQAQLRPNGSAS